MADPSGSGEPVPAPTTRFCDWCRGTGRLPIEAASLGGGWPPGSHIGIDPGEPDAQDVCPKCGGGTDRPCECPASPGGETPTPGRHRNVYEYDGAYKCLDCQAEWGALPGHPKMPPTCSGLGEPVPPEAPDTDRIYPCDMCGVLRSRNEGGTVFTVCEDCWKIAYPPEAPERKPTDVCECGHTRADHVSVGTFCCVNGCECNSFEPPVSGGGVSSPGEPQQ